MSKKFSQPEVTFNLVDYDNPNKSYGEVRICGISGRRLRVQTHWWEQEPELITVNGVEYQLDLVVAEVKSFNEDDYVRSAHSYRPVWPTEAPFPLEWKIESQGRLTRHKSVKGDDSASSSARTKVHLAVANLVRLFLKTDEGRNFLLQSAAANWQTRVDLAMRKFTDAKEALVEAQNEVDAETNNLVMFLQAHPEVKPNKEVAV